MQRSVRENIALPFTTPRSALGPDRRRRRAARRSTGRSPRSRSTRAPRREVRRLSGGNQQKVTIARWVAGGVRTMLCFDPTRGIDIGTKQPDLPAAPRPRRRGRGGPALHLGAQGDPARLRPGDRHLRRPRRGRDRRRRRRRADAPPGRLRPAARGADARGGRSRRRVADAARPRRPRPRGERRMSSRDATPCRANARPSIAGGASRAWARRNVWTLGLLGLLVVLLRDHEAAPAELRRRRRSRASAIADPADRLRRRRPGHRRDRRRHRPLGRLDDGAHQRHRRPS